MSIFREHTYTHAQMYTPSDMWIHDSNTGLATLTHTIFVKTSFDTHIYIGSAWSFLLVFFFETKKKEKDFGVYVAHKAHSTNHNIATTHSMRRREKMISKMKFFFSGLEIWNELNTEFQLRERKIELPKIDWRWWDEREAIWMQRWRRRRWCVYRNKQWW